MQGGIIARKKVEFDSRSVASSMAAERDDKSVFEEPAVGAVEGEERRFCLPAQGNALGARR